MVHERFSNLKIKKICFLIYIILASPEKWYYRISEYTYLVVYFPSDSKRNWFLELPPFQSPTYNCPREKQSNNKSSPVYLNVLSLCFIYCYCKRNFNRELQTFQVEWQVQMVDHKYARYKDDLACCKLQWYFWNVFCTYKQTLSLYKDDNKRFIDWNGLVYITQTLRVLFWVNMNA